MKLKNDGEFEQDTPEENPEVASLQRGLKLLAIGWGLSLLVATLFDGTRGFQVWVVVSVAIIICAGLFLIMSAVP